MGTCLALSTCASFLAVCTSDKNLTVWNLSSMDVLKQWKAARKVSSLTFNSDSSQLLVAGNNVYICPTIKFNGLDYCLPYIISRQSWWLLYLLVEWSYWPRKAHSGTSFHAIECGMYFSFFTWLVILIYYFLIFRLSHLITNLSSLVKEMKKSGFLAYPMLTIYIHIVWDTQNLSHLWLLFKIIYYYQALV